MRYGFFKDRDITNSWLLASEQLYRLFNFNIFSNFLLVIFIISLLSVIGCKDEEEIKNPPQKESHGIGYFLPKLPIEFSSYNGSQYLIPKIAFNYPIDSIFQFETDTGTYDFHFKLDSFTISSGQYVENITPSMTKWNNSRDSLAVLFHPIPDAKKEKEEYNLNLTLQLLAKIDEEWVSMKVFEQSGSYSKSLSWSITRLADDLQWVKSSQFRTEAAQNPYKSLLFNLSFISNDEYQWVDSLDNEVRFVYEIEVSREGEPLEFEFHINEYDRTLEILIDEILCELCEYNITISNKYFIRLFGEEITLTNGDGQINHINNFKFKGGHRVSSTGLAIENIEYAYPVDRQYHFLVNEYNKGYLKIYRDQKELLKNENNSSWTKHVRISDLSMSYSVTLPLYYSDKYFEYDMPQDLAKETIFRVEFLEKSNNEEDIFYSFYFRTSIYDTFLNKIENNGPSKDYFKDPLGGDKGHRIGNNIVFKDEIFDDIEIKGLPENGVKPFLVLFNDFDNNYYYQNKVYPRIYEVVEKGILSIESNLHAGVPPINSVFWWDTSSKKFNLSDDQIESNLAPNHFMSNKSDFGGTVSIMALSIFIAHRREIVIKAKAYDGPQNDLVDKIVETEFQPLPYPENVFPYFIEYRLPGNKNISSYHHPNKIE